MRLFVFLSILALSACTAADVQPRETDKDPVEAGLWKYQHHASELRATSCPEASAFTRAPSIDLKIVEAERGPADARRLNLSAMKLSGAWHLKSEDPEFGGLSGLEVMRSGSLLAVTDDGKFAWIGIDPETGTPDGSAALAAMRDTDGNVFATKRDADAEDLALRDGLAFVSFEQDHRIAAYDLESCGAAARAAPVVDLDLVVAGRRLENNRGPEALAFSDGGLAVGFEMRANGGSPVGLVQTNGALQSVHRTQQPRLYLLTAIDQQDGLQAAIFRTYDPARGPRAIVTVRDNSSEIARAVLRKPLPVDNFEGVAIGLSPAGKPRIWVVSDDNFSRDQRTLLLALDLDS